MGSSSSARRRLETTNATAATKAAPKPAKVAITHAGSPACWRSPEDVTSVAWDFSGAAGCGCGTVAAWSALLSLSAAASGCDAESPWSVLSSLPDCSAVASGFGVESTWSALLSCATAASGFVVGSPWSALPDCSAAASGFVGEAAVCDSASPSPALVSVEVAASLSESDSVCGAGTDYSSFTCTVTSTLCWVVSTSPEILTSVPATNSSALGTSHTTDSSLV